ncbi:hypothetical protein PR048_015283 [Dryococelus australis]|uniref:Uncharacterized protein n=1 Tax=Dryococelus australis TaxID=614101 RepID=A0ABQ9HGI7_9NEOP|nr:hypothetical protein PR048_015283 [Dryococelus australis]
MALAPFLYIHICYILRSLMARIVRDGKALLNFDLENIDNLSKVSSVDVGVLKCRQVLISVIEKVRKRSGVSRSVTSLDPKVIIHEPTCG